MQKLPPPPARIHRYTKKQLRSMFNSLLQTPDIQQFLAKPPSANFRGTEAIVSKSDSSLSMIYETEQGFKRSILICFDANCPERAPTLANYPVDQKAIVIGKDYIQNCSAEELRVRVALELGQTVPSEARSAKALASNSHKVGYYNEMLEFLGGVYSHSENTVTLKDQTQKVAEEASFRSLKVSYLRAMFFYFIRGGIREYLRTADRLAVRYCGLELVVRYLAVCSSKTNDVERIEILNRIEAISKQAREVYPEPKPLALGLSGKTFMGPRVTSARCGNGYEASSHGDKRFSAMFAKMPDGRTIEMHYQCDLKQYDPGGTNWKLGKGKPPKDTSVDLFKGYLELWRTWSKHHLEVFADLLELLPHYNYLLTDKFATTPVNQARALAQLCNEYYSHRESKEQH